MKISVIVVAFVVLAGLLFVFAKNTLITLGSSGALPQYSIDDKINRAELILIGEVTTTLPSKWKGPAGSDPKNASPEDVIRARGLFTDSLISINQILKGDIVTPVVRVRAFTGQTGNVVWASESEPCYIKGRTYLLFLRKDHGPTADVDPGDYVAVGAVQGVYEIVDGKAISTDDEWVLEELIAYIEQSLSAASPLPAETSASLDLSTETPLPADTTIAAP